MQRPANIRFMSSNLIPLPCCLVSRRYVYYLPDTDLTYRTPRRKTLQTAKPRDCNLPSPSLPRQATTSTEKVPYSAQTATSEFSSQ